MKTTISFTRLVVIFFLFISSNLCAQTFQNLNFECGGYVTGVTYIAGLNPTSNHSILARTDIGGIYMATYNSGTYTYNDWVFLSQFARTPASLMVQGIAPYPNLSNPTAFLIACGVSYLDSDPGRGIWKTTNSGVNWSQKLVINFGGNDYDQKRGGECIIYDKNDPDYMYAGGRRLNPGDPTSEATVYWSTNGGDNWSDINSDDVVRGNVFSIIVNPTNSNQVWVGTDQGLYKGTYNTGKSQWEWVNKKSGVSVSSPVYRVVMKPDASYIYLAQGTDLYISTNSGTNWIDKTSGFDTSYPDKEITNICYDEIEEELFVSRITYPSKMTTDNGACDSWTDEIEFNLNTTYNPLHQLSGKERIYDGKANIMLNGPGIEFSSGGAGPYIPTTSDWINDDWRYFVNGMSMTVVYDVSVDPYISKGDYNIYIPLSDWSMARTHNSDLPDMYDYSREGTSPGSEFDSDIPNVTRALIFPNATSTVLLIGGNVYTYQAAMFKMQLSTTDISGGTTYTKLDDNGLPLYDNGDDRTLIDGIIAYNSSTSQNNVVVLVGGGEDKVQIDGTGDEKGLYYSTNGGANFTKSTYNGTYSQYGNSYVDGLFSSQFNLANHPTNIAIKYAYLENGGMFKSTDYGASWDRISEVVQNPGTEYKDEGCLKVIDNSGNPEFYLAIKDRGLYKSTNDGVNWSSMSGWVTASQVEVTSTRMYAFGKRTSDTYDKIYLSTNSGANWNCITDGFESTIGTIPSTRGLRHDIHEDKVYISTSGQGVFVYSPTASEEEDSRISNISLSGKLNLFENYPNPFNPSTKIRYTLGEKSLVQIKIYDILGREVYSLLNEQQEEGYHEVKFDAGRLSSGVYYYRIKAGDFVETRRMVLMK